jgi:hypothetical protein
LRLAAGKKKSIKGLGSGEGWGDAGEVDGSYDQLGDVEEVIEYVDGPDDMGAFSDMGDTDGPFAELGEVISDADGAFDQVGDVEEVEEVIGLVEGMGDSDGAEDVGDYEGIGLYENDA